MWRLAVLVLHMVNPQQNVASTLPRTQARQRKRSHGPLRDTHLLSAEVAFSVFQTLETPRNEAG